MIDLIVQQHRDKIITAISNIPREREAQHTPEEIFDKYIKTFYELLTWADYRARTEADLKLNIYRLPVTKLRTLCGRFGGDNTYWSDWFNANFPLYNIITIGNNNKKTKKSYMSQITLTPLALDLIFGNSINDPDITVGITKRMLQNNTSLELATAHIDGLDINTAHITPINIDSLTAYIDKTEQQRLTNSYIDGAVEYRRKIDNALKSALMIQSLAIGTDLYTDGLNGPTLIQASSKSDFGRVYLTGVNLQSCPKVVREAALGHCYEYDISASVFTWRNDEVRRICDELNDNNNIDFKPSYTLEYLEDKDGFRRHIAKLCFPQAFARNDDNEIKYAIKIAKQILTSVGFGATTKNIGWYDSTGGYKTTAIKELVKNTTDFNNLVTDDRFSAFMREQTAISAIIIEYHTYMPHGQLYDISDNLVKQLKSKSQCMAYLYQQFEFTLIEFIKQQAKKYNSDLEVLLTVHDAIYTNKRIDLQVVSDVQKTLSPSFKFDSKVIKSFANLNAESDHDREEREHRELIAEQERIARRQYGANSYEPPKYTNDYSHCLDQDDINEVDKQAAAIEMAEFVEQAQRNRNPVSALKNPDKTAEESAANRARLEQLMGKK